MVLMANRAQAESKGIMLTQELRDRVRKMRMAQCEDREPGQGNPR